MSKENPVSESTLALAKAITASTNAYEASFDKDEALRLRTEYEDKLRACSQYDVPLMPDYNKCYKLSLHDACMQEAGTHMSQPVYLLLRNSWNDALQWADEIARTYFNH